ncbi:MAG: type 1 glutamine amidotransferase [Chelatococcus sp.]|nr:type 1 glutamine amidotransferase [Chelatococcus sp.]MBX3538639.1 type 1 glutamine amidotransferase [Chelatococcus sp.]
MSTMRPRILVAEGNTAEARRRRVSLAGATYSESYADVLRGLAPNAVIDICYPADAGANLPDPGGLQGYDGVAITGSSLNVYAADPEVMRQVEFARAVFASGVPFFGSCWGLQVAATAAGGSVRRSPKGREMGLARKIRLTEAGLGHPLHQGKGPVYDAPAIHTDEVDVRPAGMTVTATNAFSDVQAAEIRYDGGIFWGVQYHPEFTITDIAIIVASRTETLLDEGLFRDAADIRAYVTDIEALAADPTRADIAWKFGIEADVIDPGLRTRELRNWLDAMVAPAMSARGRA